MSTTYYSLMATMLLLGAAIGACLVSIFVHRREALGDLAVVASHAHDAKLMDFLEKSECNLFFNPGMGAWGLLDGGNKLLATAHTVRTTLARAIEKDEGEAQHVPE